MRKGMMRLLALTIFIVMLTPLSVNFWRDGEAQGLENPTKEFTHTVFGELGTATWCPHCPPASAALYDIYSSGEYNFLYVSLVADKNPKAGLRCGELGLEGYPQTFFDGGYNNVLGGYSSTTPYINAINECGSRTDVYDVEVEPHLRWKEAEQLWVNVSITYHGSYTYTGRVRVYVTEIVSRWSDDAGRPYHFAMLDYAFNEDISISDDETVNLTTIWDGDSEGYDITPENIMIIAAVFDSHTDYVDDAAAATVFSDFPDTTIISGPEGIVNENTVTFTWTGSDKNTPTEELQYSYKLEPHDTEWSNWTYNTTVTYYDLSEGEYTFMVKARNLKGEEDPIPATRSFAVNQGIPPEVHITKPVKAIYINNNKILPFVAAIIIGDVDLEAEASDENGIEKVDFYVDGVLRHTDYYPPYRCTTWHEFSLFKRHTIRVVAYDAVDNHAESEIKVWKIF